MLVTAVAIPAPRVKRLLNIVSHGRDGTARLARLGMHPGDVVAALMRPVVELGATLMWPLSRGTPPVLIPAAHMPRDGRAQLVHDGESAEPGLLIWLRLGVFARRASRLRNQTISVIAGSRNDRSLTSNPTWTQLVGGRSFTLVTSSCRAHAADGVRTRFRRSRGSQREA